jgi:hypothetical protein
LCLYYPQKIKWAIQNPEGAADKQITAIFIFYKSFEIIESKLGTKKTESVYLRILTFMPYF